MPFRARLIDRNAFSHFLPLRAATLKPSNPHSLARVDFFRANSSYVFYVPPAQIARRESCKAAIPGIFSISHFNANTNKLATTTFKIYYTIIIYYSRENRKNKKKMKIWKDLFLHALLFKYLLV